MYVFKIYRKHKEDTVSAYLTMLYEVCCDEAATIIIQIRKKNVISPG